MAQHDNFVLLAAGGTGGHLFPARALAENLKAQKIEAVLMTDLRGAGFKGHLDDIPVIRIASASLGGGIKQKIAALYMLLKGAWAAYRYLSCHRPGVVVGFGGYPSIPVLAAARFLKIPYILHEQNALLGKANRLMARKAAYIATSFEKTKCIPQSRESRVRLTGNPVRSDFLTHRGRSYVGPGQAQGVRLLVMGGSQGAHIFSKIVPDAIALLPQNIREQLQIVQQCRSEDLETVCEKYKKMNVPAYLASFFDNVADLMADTHLLISRSGASTLAEASIIGCPALFMPYPYAADDHQASNAEAFAAVGGGWMYRDTELQAEKLANSLQNWFDDKTILTQAAHQAQALGKPDAGEALAKLACKFLSI